MIRSVTMTGKDIDNVVVLDFGSQYTHLIVRRIRELGVYAEAIPHTTPLAKLVERTPRGVVFSGGPKSVYEEGAPHPPEGFLEWQERSRTPVLGICYGMQLLAHLLGGRVAPAPAREYGLRDLKVSRDSQLLSGLQEREVVWMSHRDQVQGLPPGFRVTASTDTCPVAAFENPDRRIYGVQFHPEVRHTPRGREVLWSFLFDICRCRTGWRMADFIERTVEELRCQVGGKRVLMAVSGGIDSTVAALLLQRAVGNQLHCVFVDTGLLRQGEPERVRSELASLFTNFHVVDASSLFLDRLRGVSDPERKRRIIASTFIEVFQHAASKLARQVGPFTFLGQGTIAPDRIESGATSAASSLIKSHHNVTLPEALHLKVVEPLQLLYKDEVRRVGQELGLPRHFLRHHPFPGPGLAIRILGPVNKRRLQILRQADAILTQELERSGLYDELWQGFAVLLPVRTVGVMGDQRTYQYAIALRLVESEDAMTARIARPPWLLLERTAARIINEVPGVNRVLYDLSNKPPATIEYL